MLSEACEESGAHLFWVPGQREAASPLQRLMRARINKFQP